ncbi:MAG TPA: hypothetical protein VFR42_11915 [Candidatus Acidoferrum sp.]|nr:hypothetical protein [Candidatus Acidoferrum sp.]
MAWYAMLRAKRWPGRQLNFAQAAPRRSNTKQLPVRMENSRLPAFSQETMTLLFE